ncbi:MAG: DUF4019 domain-containing protein [Nitrosomonas sp. PRO4]|nr:DUF4019 domain-containing protein [Nitrosomonas sp. PRO4]
MRKQFLIVFFLLFYLGNVFANEKNILEIAEGSARSWLELIDNGKYRESWERASTLFKTKTAEAEWVQTVTANRASRGAVTARYIATASSAKSLSGLPDGEYIVLQFYTTFAAKGLALEAITLAKSSDGAWLVSQYSIK